MYNTNGVFDPSNQQWTPQQAPQEAEAPEGEEDTSHRPPNAFILYSQAMRSQVRQENPQLSNTEVSRILGKMWKEVPNDVKITYKQKAAALQNEFKKNHPDYTYRKARRKRALNELLTKSTQGFQPYAGMPMDPNMQMMPGAMYQTMAQNPMQPPQQPMMMYQPTMMMPQGMVPPQQIPGMGPHT